AEPSSASAVATGTDEGSRPSITRGSSREPSAGAAASRMATRPPPGTIPGRALQPAARVEPPAPVGAQRRGGGERGGDGDQARARVLYFARLMAAAILTCPPPPPPAPG